MWSAEEWVEHLEEPFHEHPFAASPGVTDTRSSIWRSDSTRMIRVSIPPRGSRSPDGWHRPRASPHRPTSSGAAGWPSSRNQHPAPRRQPHPRRRHMDRRVARPRRPSLREARRLELDFGLHSPKADGALTEAPSHLGGDTDRPSLVRARRNSARQGPTPHVPTHHGHADRPIPRLGDRARHPAQHVATRALANRSTRGYAASDSALPVAVGAGEKVVRLLECGGGGLEIGEDLREGQLAVQMHALEV